MHPLRTRAPRLGVLLAALAISWDASAANVAESLAILEPAVQDTSLAAEALYGQVRPGSDLIRQRAAVQRFQDLLFLHLIEDYAASADGFYSLVTSGALTDPALHQDAEWYLAEALFELENYSTAESRFQIVADNPRHPFRDHAVRRLLETYAITGQLDRFRELYQREVASGRVAPSDLITYSVAKSFYLQGEHGEARSRFQGIQASSPFYARAQYFLGVLAILDNDLHRAIDLFTEAVAQPAQLEDDRRIRDLGLLALGRLNYELGAYQQAAEHYHLIEAHSDYAADKLYEMAWTFIRAEGWRDALRATELFLLSFPEHEKAAHMKVVQGKLQLAEQQFDAALETFEQVIVDYDPVRQRFAQLQQATPDPAYYRRVLALSRAEDDSVPGYVVSMMRADPDLSRAIELFDELQAQDRTLRESEALVNELRLALRDSGRLGGYDNLRFSAQATSWEGVHQALELISVELAWQRQGAGLEDLTVFERRRESLQQEARALAKAADERRQRAQEHEIATKKLRQEAASLREDAAEFGRQISLIKRSTDDSSLEEDTRASVLDELRRLQSDMDEALREAEGLENRLAALGGSEGNTTAGSGPGAAELRLLEEVKQLRHDVASNRSSGSNPDVWRRFDALHVTLERAQERLQGLYTQIDRVERTDLGRIRERFDEEVAAVQTQRADHARLHGDAEQVAVDLTRDGFARLEAFFARSVLDADIGSVDVYWARKVEVANEINRVKTERQALLDRLDERFDLVKQKIGSGE